MSLWSIIFVITFGGEICTYRRMSSQFERIQYVWNYAILLNHEQKLFLAYLHYSSTYLDIN